MRWGLTQAPRERAGRVGGRGTTRCWKGSSRSGAVGRGEDFDVAWNRGKSHGGGMASVWCLDLHTRPRCRAPRHSISITGALPEPRNMHFHGHVKECPAQPWSCTAGPGRSGCQESSPVGGRGIPNAKSSQVLCTC